MKPVLWVIEEEWPEFWAPVPNGMYVVRSNARAAIRNLRDRGLGSYRLVKYEAVKVVR